MADHLGRHGLQVVEHNYEAVGAEIDIIARGHDGDDELYVFVEVRSRAHPDQGTPVETVNEKKQRQIVRAATAWLVEHDLWNKVAVRFDVVGVTYPDRESPEIEWIVGAFEAKR